MIRNSPNLPYGVRWYEGMLLTPQHFQQFEKCNFSERYFWASALSPITWGLISLEFDESALATGIFHVKACQAIFPDGLLFEYSQGISTDLVFDFSELKEEMRTTQKRLVLRVPKMLDPSLQTENKRFLSNFSTEVIDDEQSDNLVAVERKYPNVSLALENEHKGHFSEIQLVEISYDGERFVSTGFHPPAFRILPNSKLSDRIGKITANLREKTIHLSEQLKVVKKEQEGSAINNKLFLFVGLSQILPELEAQISLQAIPSEIFSLVVRLSGMLSHLINFSIPPFSGNYDHNDIVSTVEPHLSIIETALKSITRNYTLIAFERDENIFSFDLSEYPDLKQLVVVIEPSSENDNQALKSAMDQALISNKEMIADLRRKRTLGVTRKLLSTTEREKLNIGEGYLAYLVDFEGSLLKQGDFLSIRFQIDSNAKEHLKVYLYLGEN